MEWIGNVGTGNVPLTLSFFGLLRLYCALLFYIKVLKVCGEGSACELAAE